MEDILINDKIKNNLDKITKNVEKISHKNNRTLKKKITKNDIFKKISYFYKKDKKLIFKNRRGIIFINGRFNLNKTYLANEIKKSCSKKINVDIINFVDIIKKYCEVNNINIEKILFLFFTYDSDSTLFRKISNSYIEYFYNYINENYDNKTILVIKGYLFNKYIFDKINYLFDIFNIYLLNDEKEENKYIISLAKTLYYNITKKNHSSLLHKYFFSLNDIKEKDLLKIILTNKTEENNVFYILENYVNGSSKNEHLF
jgi:hypothetical protein